MNGFKVRMLLGLCGVSLLATTGCLKYYNCVDPCYPERYNAMAYQEVNAASAPQIANGHVLDQTLWNKDFENGTDKLTVGGQERLKYLARRRPQPDPVVYLQTAQDIRYDAANPDQFARSRAELDGKRIQAVHKFLGAATNQATAFQVVVHDPHEVGESARAVEGMVRQYHFSTRGSLIGGGMGGGGMGGMGGAMGGGATVMPTVSAGPATTSSTGTGGGFGR